MTRHVLLVEIGGKSLPSTTPVQRPASNWVPTVKPSVVVPPAEGVETTPGADSITITWEASPLPGAVYVVWRAPDVNGKPGSWEFVTRTSDTRYTYADASGAISWWKVTVQVNGLSSGDSSVLPVAPVMPPTTQELVAIQAKLDKGISDLMLADAGEAAQRAADIAITQGQVVALRAEQAAALVGVLDEVSSQASKQAEALLNQRLELEADIEMESVRSKTAEESLARQMSSLAAGSGTQFDHKAIWHFNAALEGWTGVYGVPVNNDGWLRPINSANNSGIQSPVPLAIDGAAYRFIKMRLRLVGKPNWLGLVRWITDANTTWDDAKSVTLPAPSFDSAGVATIDVSDLPWNSGSPLRAIRLALTGAQTAASYIEFDWVAIGRPTPGASVAMVQEEAEARNSAIAAEASQRSTLATQIRGNYTGNDLSGVTQGFIADAKRAWTSADAVQVERINVMEVRMPAGNGSLATSASVNALQDATTQADQANARDITGVKAELADKASASGQAALETKVRNIDGQLLSQGTAINNVTAKADGLVVGVGDLKVYNICASAGIGNPPSGAPLGSGIRNAAGVLLYNGLRGFNVIPINADGTLGTRVAFDSWGATTKLQEMADYISALPETQYFLAYTSDSVGTTHTDAPSQNAVRAAMLDAGASMATWKLVTGSRMYVFIGRRRLGAGAGIEVLSPLARAGSSNNRLDLWCEYSLQVARGIPVGMNGNRAAAAELDAVAIATSTLDGKVAALDGVVTAQGQALTSVSGQLASISGDNLLLNSSFEERTSDGAVPMRYVTSSSLTFTVSYLDSPLTGSAKAVRMFRAAADGGAYLGIELQAVDRPAVTPGKKYVNSVYARGKAGQRMDLYIQFINASGGAAAPTTQLTFYVTTEFQRYSVTSSAPAGAVAARAIWRAHNSGTVGDLDLTIDNAKFEVGEVATAWTQNAAELASQSVANAAANTALTGRVTAAEGSIASLGTSVTSVNASLGNLLTGGVGIFPQGTMEAFAVGQQLSSSNGVVFTVRGGGANSGVNIRRTGDRALELNVVTAQTSGNADCNLTADVPVSPSRTYYVEGYFRLTEASIVPTTGAVYLGVRSSDDAGTSLAWPVVYANHNTLSKNAWTKVSGYITTNSAAARIRAFISMRGDRRAGTIIALDDFSIMDVTDARAAQTTADAAAGGLSQLSASVTQQGGQITAQGTRIDSVQAQLEGKASSQSMLLLDAKVSASVAGGGNLVANALLDGPLGVGTTPGWEGFWSPEDVKGLRKYVQQGPGFAGGASDPGIPVGMRALIVAGLADRNGITYVWPAVDLPVEGDKTYIFSVYASGYAGYFVVACLNSAGSEIGRGTCPLTNLPGGGATIESYLRLWSKFHAPAGTATMRIHLATQHVAGQDRFVRWLRPMLEQVAPDKTGPSPWSAGGNESYATASLMTDVDGVIAGLQVRNSGGKGEVKILSDVFRVLAPGGADGIEWQNGYIRVYKGNSQRIIGTGFGDPSESLMDYFGPNIGAAAASKANATVWMDANGNAHWNGSLSAGVLRNAVQTTTTTTVGASVTTGLFSTNGRNKAVTIGFSRRHSRIKSALGSQGFVAGAGANGATINVYRTLNGQGEVLWQQFAVGGSVEVLNEFDGPDRATSTWAGSISINDNSDGSAQRSYRAEVVGFSEQSVTHQSGSFDQQTITQSLSLVSIEQ